MTVKPFTLANGNEIPALGLGTWLLSNEKAEAAVVAAVQAGYRHIDTAQAYQNEKGVGAGVRASGLQRDELYITTKVAAEHKNYDDAYTSIKQSLAEAELDYYDLVLIHSPQPWVEVNQSDDRHFEGNREAWRALETAYKEGLVKAIGVSNFLEEDLQNLLDHAEIKPMVNQILCHITNTPEDLIAFCHNNNIVVEAYSPIAHGAVLHREDVKAVADKYGVSVAQLCLRYDIQLGLVVLPKSANPAHIQNNAELDFVISDEDMATLKGLAPLENYGDHSFFPVFGGKL